MPPGERHQRGVAALQYQAYRTLHIPFIIKGSITVRDDIRKTAWHNGLTQYIASNPHSNYSNYTTIKGARQIASDLNVKIGRTAITILIRNNRCGFQLNGRRGQWVVNREVMRKFLIGIKG